jgi:hypothetical protein
VLVLTQAISILLHVGLLLRLEVDDLDRVVLAPDQVDAALEDVLILDERNLNFSLLDAIPVPFSLVVAQHVQQRCLLRGGCEVDALLFGEHGVVGREPALDGVEGDGAFLAAQHGLVDVLDGLMHQRTEEHRALADGRELQLLEEAVLLAQFSNTVMCEVNEYSRLRLICLTAS